MPHEMESKDLQVAGTLVSRARRIAILGCSGSGKSTLARALAIRLDLPYVSLDRDVLWLPGWTLRPVEERRQRLAAAVAGDSWIIDGNTSSALEGRLAHADVVLWLRPTRLASLKGIFCRWLRHRGRSRPDMAEGCPERLTLEFLRYVWSFEHEQVPKFQAAFAKARPDLPIITLRSRQEVNGMMRSVARV